ncbi:MAG: cupin domain-containing protein [Cyclobacteriaceae bacterium]
MERIKKIDWQNLKHEYGVDGQRLLPWGDAEFPFPFGGAYCITKAHTSSLEHVNEPSDEEEMFIVISGKAFVHLGKEKKKIEQGDIVYIPAGVSHFVENPNSEDCHFYALWWNRQIVEGFQQDK